MSELSGAELALAVGKRVYPEREWFDTAYWTGTGYRPYNPTTGADAAEAEAWLWERCATKENAIVCIPPGGMKDDKTPITEWAVLIINSFDFELGYEYPATYEAVYAGTPAIARARIIANWPEGGE